MQKTHYYTTSVLIPPEMREEAHELGINVSAACREGVEAAIERKLAYLRRTTEDKKVLENDDEA